MFWQILAKVTPFGLGLLFEKDQKHQIVNKLWQISRPKLAFLANFGDHILEVSFFSPLTLVLGQRPSGLCNNV